MYEAYWNLTCKPFEQHANERFYYPSESQQAAALKLKYVVENRGGAALVCGASGVGKTRLVAALFEQLDETCQPQRRLAFPQLRREELLRYLADELTGTPWDTRQPLGADVSVRRLEQALLANAQQGRHAVLAIDDAHLLEDSEVLETLRLLLNFEVAEQPVLSMILVGHPNLVTMVDRCSALEERLGVKCLLRPLSLEETVSYVHHRLQAAGAARMLFTDDAVDMVHALSQGVPRRINRLCDLALLVGYAEEVSQISGSQVESVAEELITIRAD